MKIGIIIAMDVEYRRMLDVLGGKPQGRIGGNDVVLWQCGIGKVNAAIGTARLVQEHHPDCILSTGLAGGIDNSLSRRWKWGWNEGVLTLNDVEKGTKIHVYDLRGGTVMSTVARETSLLLTLPPHQMYIVKVGEEVIKLGR